MAFEAITNTIPSATISQWRQEDLSPRRNAKGIWESIYKLKNTKRGCVFLAARQSSNTPLLEPTQTQIANRLVQEQLKNDIHVLSPQLRTLQQQSLVSFIELGIQLQVVQ